MVYVYLQLNYVYKIILSSNHVSKPRRDELIKMRILRMFSLQIYKNIMIINTTEICSQYMYIIILKRFIKNLTETILKNVTISTVDYVCL